MPEYRVPPERVVFKEKPCPHYGLIEICNEFAGAYYFLKYSFFCGTLEKVIYIPEEISHFNRSGYHEITHIPESACSEIAKKLGEKIKSAEEKIDQSKENTWRREEQNRIIDNWRQIIWREFSGKIEEQDRFFGEIEKPEDISNGYAIYFAKKLLENLNEIKNDYNFPNLNRPEGMNERIGPCPAAQKEYTEEKLPSMK